MKKFLPVLLCLLLCGCARELPEATAPEQTEPAATVSVSIPETLPLPAPQCPEGVDAFPLRQRKVRGIRAMGEDLLVFSGYSSTTLTKLTGSGLTAAASLTLDFELSPEDPSLQVSGDSLLFFDPESREFRILDGQLQLLDTISVTEPSAISPILSADLQTVYYCTGQAVCAWELESGIHRTIKEQSYEEQQLTGLHHQDTVLQCRIRDGEIIRTQFLDTATGQLISEQPGDLSLTVTEDRYHAIVPVSAMDMPVFGQIGGESRILYPADFGARCFFLPQINGLVTAAMQADSEVRLHCYDLSSGKLYGELMLPKLQSPKSITAADGSVFILAYDPDTDCDMVYRWVPGSAPLEDTVYSDLYSGMASANEELLRQCREQAAQLSETYGITILVGEEATAVQPWDYRFEAETLPQVISRELALLEQRLSRYPEAVLQKTASLFPSLKLCLVRQVTGSAASGSLEAATGVQFFDEADAYVVIAAGKYSEQALYHELFHVMETYLLNESTALDGWNELNPAGFVYSFGYALPEDPEAYLADDSRAFVDLYSMTYPKEDRARVFENAMLPGKDALFTSETMQKKLTALCLGLRDAYDLPSSAGPYPWEQYLLFPLT